MAGLDLLAVPNDSAHVTFQALNLGRCREEILCRLLRFWDSRNINRDNEFMGITMLFLDEKVISYYLTDHIRVLLLSISITDHIRWTNVRHVIRFGRRVNLLVMVVMVSFSLLAFVNSYALVCSF